MPRPRNSLGRLLLDRRAFAREHMASLGNEGDSDDLAYQIVRRYMEQ